jgi:putative addiction module killer protein
MFEVLDYLSPKGKDLYIEWLGGLVDRQARARILVRVQRIAAGNFGDCKPLQVWNCASTGGRATACITPSGKRLILLLAGGDKRKQQADIAQALERWHDWQHRRKNP